MFHLDPNEMVGHSLALRERELRRTAERARLLGDHRPAGWRARVFARVLRGVATTLKAPARRIQRHGASVQEDCA